MKDRILFADDDKALRGILELYLKLEFPELDVESFKDGKSLEKRLNESLEGVRLVLTDDNMPGVNGSEIIMAYAQRPEFSHLPFILFFGGDPSLGEDLVNKHGAFAYSRKGEGTHALLEKIKEALSYSRPIQSSQ